MSTFFDRYCRIASGLALFATGIAIANAQEAPAIAFYAPWDPTSVASLRDHGDELQAVVPAWVSVTGSDHRVAIVPDIAGRAVLAALSKQPRLWLMVQNALLGKWDGTGAADLLRDHTAASAVLDQIEAEAVKDKAAGLLFDLENLPAGSQPDLLAFLATVHERCRRHDWVLAVAAPVGNSDWDLAKLGRIADRVILMAYDEHWQSGAPGPIASDRWFASTVGNALTDVPPSRTIVAIASYAYDWPATGPATILSIEQANALASANNVKPVRDAASGSSHFSYRVNGTVHSVWMSDASSVRHQLAIIRSSQAAGAALWRLGTEDPAIWPVKRIFNHTNWRR
jgi:spore germination protein YaaH